MGRRDYAIVLLLARLGLRANEVSGLELEDINWKAGQLSVRGKRDHRTVLPLPADVGAAIAAYLRQGAQPAPSRRAFLRSKAPIRGFLGQCAIGSIIRHPAAPGRYCRAHDWGASVSACAGDADVAPRRFVGRNR